jgi:hypothetical protein
MITQYMLPVSMSRDTNTALFSLIGQWAIDLLQGMGLFLSWHAGEGVASVGGFGADGVIFSSSLMAKL